MRHYEVMVILDPSLDERTVAPSLDTFLNVIRTTGGNVEKVEVWGKRRLSFEINKNSEGIYAVLDLTSTPDAVKELDRQLGLQETVLRTKVLRREPAKAAKLAAKAAAKSDAKSAKSAARAAARA
ncbi:30S ribosomal protein S6 [Lentzea sp. BCCO 10_0798]|jgi:small subunit ribosomal protein S6|uniref:Small ribosomal subunit protein bS6 n=1 Tax=Lentzea kristufekii TaxID=3095430 RepID=A0ABU4TM54_9PSEU|nr:MULTISPECIES: 30S ribosomal protein S6 [unclassified Lentzea]MCX2948449.1 30S ribosomal protein S6 [Lentzea sp. NEAU-D7]MDX8049360.1 30S ribosomal protein S6 [Lentzea sp. BCCO 10_0798]